MNDDVKIDLEDALYAALLSEGNNALMRLEMLKKVREKYHQLVTKQEMVDLFEKILREAAESQIKRLRRAFSGKW